ncbi:hypothetical protein [Xanthobacter sp. YC-JY1]|uniref:hypothetical protein n=1 Tax=Xanthobacter sp. YC-JY1 TaxID=2419844 RepID=UPI001F247265|nr:hypothetical protein [Xanthobacter sp. YC-JY1]UJX45520.1 hypothetical protein D7006_12915 [Xanthobacter sp. YC-JY1]
MLEWMDRTLSILNSNFDVPGWVVLAAMVVGAVFVFVLFVRSEPNENPLTLLVLIGILLGGLSVGSAMVKQIIQAASISEARALEARASGLDAAAAQTAALGCIGADPSLTGVCEAVLFERPDTVASARSMVRARMALVEDAFEFVRRRKADYLTERIIAWRRPLEQDPYGLVASALVDFSGCTVSYCPQAAIFGDPTHIIANMNEGRYASLIAKYTPVWERNARNRGMTGGPPPRTGPFGMLLTQPDPAHAAQPGAPGAPAVAAPAAAPAAEDPDVIAAPPTAPLPPARPARTPAAQATPPANPTPRPAAPRPRPPAQPAAPADAEPAADGTGAGANGQ